MKLKELKKFVNKHSTEYVKVKLHNVSPFAAWIHTRRVPVLLKVDRYWWNYKLKHDPVEAKALMFHELGHINTWYDYDAGRVQNELDAQLWAIRKAKKLKRTKMRKYLIFRFQEWANYDWNSSMRRYILARRRFVKEKMRY